MVSVVSIFDCASLPSLRYHNLIIFVYSFIHFIGTAIANDSLKLQIASTQACLDDLKAISIKRSISSDTQLDTSSNPSASTNQILSSRAGLMIVRFNCVSQLSDCSLTQGYNTNIPVVGIPNGITENIWMSYWVSIGSSGKPQTIRYCY